MNIFLVKFTMGMDHKCEIVAHGEPATCDRKVLLGRNLWSV